MSRIGWMTLSSIVILVISFTLLVISLRVTEIDGHLLSGFPSILFTIPIFVIIILVITVLGKWFDIDFEDYGSFHLFQMLFLIFASFYFAVDCCEHKGRIQRHVDNFLISILPIEKNPEDRIIGFWEAKIDGNSFIYLFHEGNTGQLIFGEEAPIDMNWFIYSATTPYQLAITTTLFGEETTEAFIRFLSDTELEFSENESFSTKDGKREILTKQASRMANENCDARCQYERDSGETWEELKERVENPNNELIESIERGEFEY